MENDLNQLPEEILERIFSFTSPYRDYQNISLVCHKWNRIMLSVKIFDQKLFKECFENGTICWNSIKNDTTPTQRHSHASCRIEDRLYIFGGLSNTHTSYNDLWSLDLNNKLWQRLVTDGQYPAPKAASTLVTYKGMLILYGGYSHPYQHPVHQQVNFFDELHTFSVAVSYWHLKIFSSGAPKLAGHTASIVNANQMVMFGGCNGSLANKTNTVYCLDLDSYEWLQRDVLGVNIPEARYGHSQTSLDDERILIVGGCGGPNSLYDDIWLLLWPRCLKQATWQRLVVNQTINAPIQLYCVSVVKCYDKLLTLGKPKIQIDNPDSKSKCSCSKMTVSDTDSNAKIKITPPSTSNPKPSLNMKPNSLNASNINLSKSERNKIKRLEILQNIAHKYTSNGTSAKTAAKCMNTCRIHSKLMQIFILDIKAIVQQSTRDCNAVEWLEPIANFAHAPPNTVLYSLTKGINEIILFGGVEMESMFISSSQHATHNQETDKVHDKVTKALYVVKAVKN